MRRVTTFLDCTQHVRTTAGMKQFNMQVSTVQSIVVQSRDEKVMADFPGP